MKQGLPGEFEAGLEFRLHDMIHAMAVKDFDLLRRFRAGDNAKAGIDFFDL